MKIHVADCESKMEAAYRRSKNHEWRGDYEASDRAKCEAREWRRRRDYARSHGAYWESEDEPPPDAATKLVALVAQCRGMIGPALEEINAMHKREVENSTFPLDPLRKA